MRPSLRYSAFGLVLLGATALACTTSTTAPSAAPEPSGTPDSTPQAGAPDAPCDPPAITFQTSSVAITPTRDHHHTLVHEVAGVPYLYVIGGEQEDFATVHADVQRARIEADGSIEPFEDAGTLPVGRAGAALAVVGDDVVLAGGVLASRGFSSTIIVGRFDANGRLDTWKNGPTLPKSVMHAAAVVIDRDVYVFGGTTGSAATTVSVKTTVSAEGELAPLVSLTPLDSPRSHHVAFVDGQSVYLVGGLDKAPTSNPPSLNDAVQAVVQSDGTLAAWHGVGTLAEPLSIASVQKLGCSYVFPGGLDDTVKAGTYSNRILRATIGSDGAFRSEASLTPTLSVARGHVHQTPLYKQFMYSVGGRGNDFDTLGLVDIGTVAQ